jgi:hypothetical protein
MKLKENCDAITAKVGIEVIIGIQGIVFVDDNYKCVILDYIICRYSRKPFLLPDHYVELIAQC